MNPPPAILRGQLLAPAISPQPSSERSGRSSAGHGHPAPGAGRRPPGRPEPALTWLLGLLTLLTFARLAWAEFIIYDDRMYVWDNPHVLGGLTPDGLRWAFTTFACTNWHPLTWISLQADAAVWGGWAGGFHLTNVVLHAVSAMLLFRWLHGLTGAIAPAWLTAALFALHPTHVESVAWVAERKDVLSGLFFLLTLLAYGAWARGGRSPAPANPVGGAAPDRPGSLASAPRAGWYAAALGCFALGLLAKPMLVTLPCLLVLLDLWPLDRLGATRTSGADPSHPAPLGPGGWGGWGAHLLRVGGRAARRLPEKIPFFALAAGSCVVTCLAQRGAIVPVTHYPWPWRLLGALWAVGQYVAKTFWPVDLIVPRLYPSAPPLWTIGAVVLGLLAASFLVCRELSRRPYLFVGWWWFLGMLVPVVGLVQVGSQGMADRYLYLPQIGLCGALSFALADGAKRLGAGGPRMLWTVGSGLLVCLAGLSFHQAGYWENGLALFSHTRRIQGPSYIVSSLLAMSEQSAGRLEDAAGHYDEALRYGGDDRDRAGVASLYMELRRWDRARPYLEELTRRHPEEAAYWNSLGVVLALGGDGVQARRAFEQCLRVRSDFAPARRHLDALRAAGVGP